MQAIRIVNSIDKIKKEAWDALIEDNPFACHGWLKTVEEAFIEDMRPQYILFEDAESLAGAIVCYYQKKSDTVETLDDLLFGRLMRPLSRLGMSFLPALICCPYRCYGQHFLISKGLEPGQKELIMRELLRAVEQAGAGENLPLAFPNVMDKEEMLVRLLKEKGYHRAAHMPLSYLDIEWTSFTEYINHVKCFGKGTNKAINNEINRNRKEGVTISIMECPKEHEGRLYALLNDNYLRYNQRPFMFKMPFITKLKEYLGKDVLFYVSLKKGIITGVSILMKRQKTGYGFILGVDHEMAGNDFTYFNIAYYRPIMDAISEGMTRLHFGTAMYESKISRGCKMDNISFYYKPFHRLNNIPTKFWFTVFSSWMKYKLPKAVRKNFTLKSTS